MSGVECERAPPYLRAITASFGLATPYHLHLDEVIPAHAGLGSGTQLALAIGSAVAVLEGLPLDLTGIAARLERGKRSGIGIGTFEQGGAVLDGGPSNGALPEVLWRVPFPSEWRVLLIFDPAETGVHGANEIAAFAALPDFPETETEDLTRRILQAALPALAAEDFKTFCDEVGYLQKEMGAYFAPIQGGPYVSAGVAAVLKGLAEGRRHRAWAKLLGADGVCLRRLRSRGRGVACGRAGYAGGAKLRFELAQGRNEPAIIEAR